MKVCGFSFVRNALANDYPVVEAVKSVLALCDEFQLVVADSTNGTLDYLRAGLDDPRVVITEAPWDDSARTGGRILARLTNVALARSSGDWGLYIQADEAVHERYHPALRACLEHHLGDPEVQGLLFRFRHFYGGYRTIHTGRKWYRREVRVIRLGIGLESWGDAMGFRFPDGKKPKVVWAADAEVFHYGWARPERTFRAKQRSFARLYSSDDALVESRLTAPGESVYRNSRYIVPFTGTHPAPMRPRVAAAEESGGPSGPFADTPGRRALEAVERRLRVRFGEPRNFRLLGKKRGPDGFPAEPFPFDAPPTA
ncbi:MAG TPA: glycosyltransferase family 2 protein [Candidatus Coatesbacteria bacterium]|nr:glycosyltransferase family 2 protein [Candidatus Coatesbacteria bacterium]